MIGHRTGSQFAHGEELGLVLADVTCSGLQKPSSASSFTVVVTL
jgi:hypothetical protein